VEAGDAERLDTRRFTMWRSEVKEANAARDTPPLLRACGVGTGCSGVGDVGLDAGMGTVAVAVGDPLRLPLELRQAGHDPTSKCERKHPGKNVATRCSARLSSNGELHRALA